MVSYLSESSGVLERIKGEAKCFALFDYLSNGTKNKSAFVSRHAARHYERLLVVHYKDAERRRTVLQNSNAKMKAEIARLRRILYRLQDDIEFHSLLAKLDGTTRSAEPARIVQK